MAKILFLLMTVMWFMAGVPAYAQQQVAPGGSGPDEEVRKYTGVIKNQTKYDVFVPSLNSGATLTVPAQGYIEYITWANRFDIIAYRRGIPVFCQKMIASPGQYPFVCKNYDFVAEIVQIDPDPECIPKQRTIRKKGIRRAPKVEG